MTTARERPAHERGSALLLVFILAACLAILLYAQVPVIVFEARRNREQILIDRGEEYAHAVKLFVRRFGSYPPTLDALDETNRMRFLRRRYDDPMTGQNEWRLLHAGPGGRLLDSKVPPVKTVAAGDGREQSESSHGISSAAAISSLSGLEQSVSSAASESMGEILRSSPAGNGFGGQAGSGFGAKADPTTPLSPSTPSEITSAAAAQMEAGQKVVGGGGEGPVQGMVTPGSSTVGAVGQQLADSGSGPLMGGGIAGVASRGSGHSIKNINDQFQYSLWEFYYDPSTDPMRLGLVGRTGFVSIGTGSAGQPGAAGGAGTTNLANPPSFNKFPQ